MIVNVNMQPRTAVRAAVALVAGLAPMAPSMVCAQDWSLYGGVVMRGEYNDNYFLTAGDTQSAFTASSYPIRNRGEEIRNEQRSGRASHRREQSLGPFSDKRLRKWACRP